MEPYKEIVNIEEYHFFKGLADLKYGAVHNRRKSEKSQENHYSHKDYYDIEIYDVVKFQSIEDFKKWKPKFQLNPIRKNIVLVHYEGQEYGVEADVLYIHESLFVDHVQIEGEELHGEFNQVPVVFRMHSIKEIIRCIPNCPTGREEIREDGLYKEYTTGELEKDGETCSTRWSKEIPTPPIICPSNEPTGNRETKNQCYRLEYFSGKLNLDNSTCETYWGDWICNCTQDEWTGNTKKHQGWIWREYFNSDCSTYWKQFEKLPEPKGCLNFIPLILAVLWAILCCYWAIKYGSFLPILIGIGIPLFVAGFGYFVNFLGRFARGIGRIFNWTMNLLMILIIFFMLKGLVSFFSESKWGMEPSSVDSAWEQQEIITEDDDENFIDTENGKKIKRDKITIKLKWTDFQKNHFEGTFSLYKDEIASSSENLQNLKADGLSTFSTVYSKVYDVDKNYLGDLYKMLDEIRIKKQQNKFEFANTIVSMIQSIDYVLILEEGCNDQSVLRNEEIMKMKLAGIPCDGNAAFGIKTPSEFLSSLKGDCDSRTLLLYTIFKHYNYDVAIINSEFYGHSMLGLGLPGVTGVSKTMNGKKYFFWETTSKGFRIGQLPQENGVLNYWKIELN